MQLDGAKETPQHTRCSNPILPGISVISWNVAGLERSRLIPDWLALIKSFDICCLQETWDLYALNMEGYKCYVKPATASSSGRAAEELAVWIITLLRVEEVPLSSSAVQILRIKPQVQETLILINFYNNDFGKDNIANFKELFGIISHIKKERYMGKTYNILLCGDFNAKLALNQI